MNVTAGIKNQADLTLKSFSRLVSGEKNLAGMPLVLLYLGGRKKLLLHIGSRFQEHE